jgi:hypothetical protein
MSLISRLFGRDELPESAPMRLADLEAECAASRPAEPEARPAPQIPLRVQRAPEPGPLPRVCCDLFPLTGFQHSQACQDATAARANARRQAAIDRQLAERFPYDAAPRPLITDKTSPWAWLNEGGRRA